MPLTYAPTSASYPETTTTEVMVEDLLKLLHSWLTLPEKRKLKPLIVLD